MFMIYFTLFHLTGEGSHSGLVRPPAKRLPCESGVVGSNPTPSAVLTELIQYPEQGSNHRESIMPHYYYIWTIGCQMNKADSVHLAVSLEAAGLTAVNRADDADIIILNSCVVRRSAEQKVINKLTALRSYKEKKADTSIILTGCLAGADQEVLQKQFPFVDLFLKPQDWKTWQYWLDEQGILTGNAAAVLPAGQKSATAYVSIIKGCNNFCAYCIVPYRRGREESRSPAEIYQQVAGLVSNGVKEVTLLGQNVDSYGHDLSSKPDLADLLTELQQIRGLSRIRFLTSHPKDMSLKLIDTIARLDKVCECISLPMQAGDDDILKAMRRGYTMEQYRKLVEAIRRTVPEAALSTDVIVGFPGETEEQYQHTYKTLAELKFDTVHVASYSVRQDTLASRLDDNVPQKEKMRRLHQVEELQEKIATEINACMQGKEVEVLLEGKVRGKWFGRTRTDKLVFLEEENCRIGQLINVKINKTSPWSLQGTLRGLSCTAGE